MQTCVVKVAPRGLATLPQQLRQAHGIEPGQRLTRVDLATCQWGSSMVTVMLPSSAHDRSSAGQV